MHWWEWVLVIVGGLALLAIIGLIVFLRTVSRG